MRFMGYAGPGREKTRRLPGHIVAGILDVILSRFLEPRQLGFPQGPFDAGRRTDHQAALRDFGVFGDQCPGPDDTVVFDHDSVHQHGTHADQDAIVNGTAMKYDVVTDRDVVTDDQGIRVVGHVEQREVLDVGTMADPNIVDVAATTLWNHTLDSDSMTTSPTITAVSSMKTVSAMVGVTPR